MSNRNRRSGRPGSSSSAPQPAATPGVTPAGRSSTSPSGTARAGRRTTARRRYDEPTLFERFRTPIIAGAVAVAVIGTALFVFQSASAASYSCSTVFEPTAAAEQEGRLGAVEPDMGQAHVPFGEQVRYTYCPPASGNHVNRSGFGPIEPEAYGPNDRSQPQGWIHNLEHGALVVLYSCADRFGGCPSQDGLRALEAFVRDFNEPSPVCSFPPRTVGPVVARFDEMAQPYAALTWGRVLYMEAFDPELATQMFLTEAERLGPDGTLIMPPEKVCTPQASASPPASAPGSASPGASTSPATSASPSASG